MTTPSSISPTTKRQPKSRWATPAPLPATSAPFVSQPADALQASSSAASPSTVSSPVVVTPIQTTITATSPSTSTNPKPSSPTRILPLYEVKKRVAVTPTGDILQLDAKATLAASSTIVSRPVYKSKFPSQHARSTPTSPVGAPTAATSPAQFTSATTSSVSALGSAASGPSVSPPLRRGVPARKVSLPTAPASTSAPLAQRLGSDKSRSATASAAGSGGGRDKLSGSELEAKMQRLKLQNEQAEKRHLAMQAEASEFASIAAVEEAITAKIVAAEKVERAQRWESERGAREAREAEDLAARERVQAEVIRVRSEAAAEKKAKAQRTADIQAGINAERSREAARKLELVQSRDWDREKLESPIPSPLSRREQSPELSLSSSSSSRRRSSKFDQTREGLNYPSIAVDAEREAARERGVPHIIGVKEELGWDSVEQDDYEEEPTLASKVDVEQEPKIVEAMAHVKLDPVKPTEEIQAVDSASTVELW